MIRHGNPGDSKYTFPFKTTTEQQHLRPQQTKNAPTWEQEILRMPRTDFYPWQFHIRWKLVRRYFSCQMGLGPKQSWHACIPFPWGKVGRLHHRMQFLMKPCIQPKSSMGGAAQTCTAFYCESISSHSFILLPTKITIILSYYRPWSKSSPWSSSSLSRGGARFVHRPLLCLDLFIFLHCQALLRLTPFLLRLTDPHFLWLTFSPFYNFICSYI